MNTYLVYYAYYHNKREANEYNTSNYVENTDVHIAKVHAENHQEAEDACIEDLSLRNAGYIVLTTQL